uniref:Putative S-adenosylmethionine decarboxylase n=1 Tax=viral metagenome TaxID=1070528 RepID=A0A6M3KF90_9ZZZZ
MNNTDKSTFGTHLILDLKCCDNTLLKDYNLVFNVLSELPEKIGMTKITQPYVFPYSGLIPEDKGITGIVIIAESHISIHTFQEKEYCFIDIFSCKHFDIEYATQFLIQLFKPKIYDINCIKRGKGFKQ